MVTFGGLLVVCGRLFSFVVVACSSNYGIKKCFSGCSEISASVIVKYVEHVGIIRAF